MEKRDLLRFTCYGGFYSMFILALLEPFGIDQIKDNRLLFIFCEGMLATLVSLLSAVLYSFVRRSKGTLMEQSRLSIALDLLAVHLVNIPLLSAALLTFCGWNNKNGLLAYWLDSEGNFIWHNFLSMSAGVTVISVFVYAFLLYVLWNRRLKLLLDDALAINELLAARQEEAQERQEQPQAEVPPTALATTIMLESSTEGTSLEVVPSDIVYAESMQNYADICYLKDGQICHHQLRTTMRQLREQLADCDTLVSCHRAYIVNLNYVSSITMRPGSDYYQLQLFGQEKQIPVSRSNTAEIRNRLSAKG